MRYRELIESWDRNLFLLNEAPVSTSRETIGRYLLVITDEPNNDKKFEGIIYFDNSNQKKPTWPASSPKIGSNYLADSKEELRKIMIKAVENHNKKSGIAPSGKLNINFNVKFTQEYLKKLETHYIRFVEIDKKIYMEFVKAVKGKPGDDWIRVADTQTDNRIQGKWLTKSLEQYGLKPNYRYTLKLEDADEKDEYLLFLLEEHSPVTSSNDNVIIPEPAITIAAFR